MKSLLISYVNAVNNMLSSLRRRIHPGALFLCAQAGCGKRFKTRNAVELHRSTVGHGEAPFQIIGSSPPDKGYSMNDVHKNYSNLMLNISESGKRKVDKRVGDSKDQLSIVRYLFLNF